MKLETLAEGMSYHVYNRGINSCDLFNSRSNYEHFIKLLKKHLVPYLTIYAYCLMKNHFHFIVKIECHPKLASQKFSNLFNAYAKSFNKEYKRTGSLFEKPFKRIKLNDENYLKHLILYLHTNPVKHRISDKFETYPYSSYREILNNRSDIIPSKEIIELFGDERNFKDVHFINRLHLKKRYALE